MQKQMMFWLNTDNPMHGDAWEIAETLKAQRKFNPSVVNGLRLIHDLNQGKTDVLFELFPLLEQQFQSVTPSGNGGDSDKLLRELDTIKQLLATQGAFPASPNGQVMKKLDGASKDIDEPLIDMKKDTAAKDYPQWWDGVITVAALSENYASLAPDILAYGIRTGKVPASFAPPKVNPAAIPKQDGNAKIMQVQQFAAPVFDDD